ncbi:methyltransferase [Lithospermum erythrorhizon]|uniref:Methyltransferase n=1 Tax=Lithospermum erythrorhizon TaxID=34254 RepID=A0AAV3RIH4_LITER
MGSAIDIKTNHIEQEEQHCAYAIQLLTSASLPFVLNAAIELQVFEIIAKCGPNSQISAAEIASQMPTKNPEAASMLDRMLRLLACYSVLTCSVIEKDENDDDDCLAGRLYGLAPVGKFFVKNKDGASMGPLCALLQDKLFIQSWFELKDSVLEGGIPFNRAHGTHAFDYPSKHTGFNKLFNNAMLNHTSLIMGSILDSYKGFDELKTLVDVGGGLGINLKLITSKHPTIKGINFDLLHVVEKAPSYPGVDHVGGDMFESVPQGDAIFMKWILHDWSDDHCLKLLKNCYKSIPEDGKVIVVESIYLPKPDSSASAISSSHMDVLMMTQSPGGKERSEKEFIALAKGAGFKGVRLESFVCNFWVMEFYK